jgi:hypothetical protein
MAKFFPRVARLRQDGGLNTHPENAISCEMFPRQEEWKRKQPTARNGYFQDGRFLNHHASLNLAGLYTPSPSGAASNAGDDVQLCEAFQDFSMSRSMGYFGT